VFSRAALGVMLPNTGHCLDFSLHPRQVAKVIRPFRTEGALRAERRVPRRVFVSNPAVRKCPLYTHKRSFDYNTLNDFY
jgi:hypothetical protein